MGKLIKKLLGFILGVLVFAIVIAVAVLAWGHQYRENYTYDAPEHIEREDGAKTIIAEGRGLYDEKGDLFQIRGVNFGNLFVVEGWLSPYSMGAKMNEDGSYFKVNEDGIVEEYDEIYQEEMDALMAERFTDQQLEALNDAYFASFCTEYDFENIASMGLNTIRLPISYRSFLTTHDRYNLTDEQLCQMNFEDIEFDFDKLDWFLEMAKKYELRVIIDMHAVMGGQNGYEHCGTRDIDFWDTPEYIEFMCKLWATIANRYKVGGEKDNLASTVLAYDLANEPTNRNDIGTSPKKWAVMDLMYQAIREVDTDHVISIEGVWFFCSVPNPDRFGWENVLYQYHFYNWQSSWFPNWAFYDAMYAFLSFSDYDVPKLIGEFNLFGDKEAWMDTLNMYDDHGMGWTIWNYKAISVGYWDNSWGVMVYRQYQWPVKEEDLQLKLDLNEATYEEILELWSNLETDDGTNDGPYKVHEDGVTWHVLKEFFEQEKFQNEK